MVDILWYIDGHHATFNDRNKKIPVDLLKHRKIQIENMSALALREYSIFSHACKENTGSIIQTGNHLKVMYIEGLAMSVADYATVQSLHSQLHPVHQLSENISLTILPR